MSETLYLVLFRHSFQTSVVFISHFSSLEASSIFGSNSLPLSLANYVTELECFPFTLRQMLHRFLAFVTLLHKERLETFNDFFCFVKM